MRVAQEKSQFFKENVEYLGFIVTNKGANTVPESVKGFQQFVEPVTLFDVHYPIFLKGKGYQEQMKKIPVSFDLTTDASASAIGGGQLR